jgi:hypothetical protein
MLRATCCPGDTGWAPLSSLKSLVAIPHLISHDRKISPPPRPHEIYIYVCLCLFVVPLVPRPALGSVWYPIPRVQGAAYPVIRRSGPEADQSHTEVKNVWNCTSIHEK